MAKSIVSRSHEYPSFRRFAIAAVQLQFTSLWHQADGSSAQRVLFLRVKMFKRFWPVGPYITAALAALARAVVHFKGSQTQFGAPAAVP